MRCQKCNTLNIEEAIRCTSCGVILKSGITHPLEPEKEQSFFIQWLKAFVTNIVRPRGLKLWIIVGCTLIFLVPALIGTFFTFIAKPYLLGQHVSSVSPEKKAIVQQDLDLIEQSRHQLTAIKTEISSYYAIHHQYPKSFMVFKGKPWENVQISMNAKGYLLADIKASHAMTLVFVPFINQQKQLAWDCYLQGFDSSLADTGCIEISQIDDIPVNGMSIYKN